MTPAEPSADAVIQTLRSGTLGSFSVLRTAASISVAMRSVLNFVPRPEPGGCRDGASERKHEDARNGDAERHGSASTSQPGRYDASAEFGMAGSWPVTIEWNGPAGQGSVSFQGSCAMKWQPTMRVIHRRWRAGALTMLLGLLSSRRRCPGHHRARQPALAA